MATTFPVALVLLTRTVLAPICASLVSATPLVESERVPFAPPTKEPKVPEYENSAEAAKEEVATLVTPAPPLEVSRPPCVMAEVVASPV
ncbi:MAG: hypothetical protein LC674_03755 [Actinobacteria bacterium]|nr:hypothetical protein [Actinomycetota bacterium]